MVLALATVVAVVLVTRHRGPWQDGEVRGPWRSLFNGYGSVALQGQDVVLAPRPPAGRDDTHAALVVSHRSYGDIALSLRVRTEAQLRSEGPNPWEVAWVLWHVSSRERFYALVLKPTGWELSKQDPDYPGGQRFLASGTTPTFPVGRWHEVGIVQVGDQLDVSVDGRALTRFRDSAGAYRSGGLGLYTEDARARFSAVTATALPAGPPGAGRAGP
jgi:hypothetical protein